MKVERFSESAYLLRICYQVVVNNALLFKDSNACSFHGAGKANYRVEPLPRRFHRIEVRFVLICLTLNGGATNETSNLILKVY